MSEPQAKPQPAPLEPELDEPEVHVAAPASASASERPPSLSLAVVLATEEGGARVKVGSRRMDAIVDASVDPELIRAAVSTGSRVVVELDGDEAVIVGTLTTQVPVSLDREGNLDLEVGHFRVKAAREAMLGTKRAFVRLRAREIETYADNLISRARDTVRLLGAMIKLN